MLNRSVINIPAQKNFKGILKNHVTLRVMVCHSTLSRIQRQRTMADITVEAERLVLLSKQDSRPSDAQIWKAEEEEAKAEASELENQFKLDVCLAAAAFYFEKGAASPKGNCE